MKKNRIDPETDIIANRPVNIVCFITDQQRWDTLGCMGHPLVRTPNLDRLAANGAIFDNAFCCSPLCVPSRVAFFTGKRPHRTGAVGNGMECHIQAGQWSFLDLLKEQGYQLGLAGKNHAFHDDYMARHFSFREEYGHWGKTHGDITESDRHVSRWLTTPGGAGNRNAQGKVMEGLVEEPMPFEPQQCPNARIATDAIAFVDRCEDQPFFLYCSFPDPHFPNATCEPYYSMYSPADLELEYAEIDWSGHPFAHFVQSQSSGFDAYTEEQRRRLLAVYLGQVSFIDNAVGTVLDALEQRGLINDTIILFTSDHGDFAGRYGLVGKTKGFQECLLRIPLIMSGPGINRGQRIQANVSNIDVMPTLADRLQLSVPESVQGRSFRPVLDGKTPTHRDAVFAEVGSLEEPPPPISHDQFPEYNRHRRQTDGLFWFVEYTCNGRSAMVRNDEWKYCFYTGDCDELYNLAEDPQETRNLAPLSEHATRRENMRNQLLQWLLTEPVQKVTP